MNWEHYCGSNGVLAGEGYWINVNYSLDSSAAKTKAFISVEKEDIVAIGHLWFADDQRHPGRHFYIFAYDGAITAEIHNSHSIVSRDNKYTIPAELSDHLIGLATSFRGIHPEYKDSLDRCVDEIQRKTKKQR